MNTETTNTRPKVALVSHRQAAVRLVFDWFTGGRTGTVGDIVASLGLSKAGVAWHVEKLKEKGVIRAMGRRTILGQGKPPTIWGATGSAFPEPPPKKPKKKRVYKPKRLRNVVDQDDGLPLYRGSTATIVERALANRHPIAVAWSSFAS